MTALWRLQNTLQALTGDFAKLMNDKAEEIGCEDSYFITPNGLDAKMKMAFITQQRQIFL